MGVSVSLGDTDLRVDPGGFVRTEVVVRNAGPDGVTVRLRVEGPAAAWSWIVPPDVEVAAGAEAPANVGFRVGRAPEPAAGPLSFSVVAVTTAGAAGDERSGEATAAGVLTVAAFEDLGVELDPADTPAGSPLDHVLVVENRGNAPVTADVASSSDDPALGVEVGSAVVEVAPGERVRVPVRVRPGGRSLLRPRSGAFTVSVTPGGGRPVARSGRLDQPARMSARVAGTAAVALVVVLAVGLRLTVLAPGEARPTTLAADAGPGGATTIAPGLGGGGCSAEGHRDTRATGLTPDEIPTLPPDYSFFQVAADSCSPVRWNPCEPVHFVINPANAPPTGVADTREAFRRLAAATGMTYVDDGLTDESSRSNRAFQPDRYPGRWAPILVHWMAGGRTQGDVQVVGGGFPTQVGDVYVTGNLFLNPTVVSNRETRSTVPGGFGEETTFGPVGAEGVTWGRIILHELAHITGLGHSSTVSNLMYPETSDQTGPAAFSRDDLAGLTLLGREAGCTETPAPGPVPTTAPPPMTGAGRP